MMNNVVRKVLLVLCLIVCFPYIGLDTPNKLRKLNWLSTHVHSFSPKCLIIK